MRGPRAFAGLALVAAGALLYAAGWQRWAAACPWPVGDTDQCGRRQDSRYEFLMPIEGWEPIGSAAQLAGVSTMTLALVLAVLPWATTGHARPRNPWLSLMLVVSAIAAVLVGVMQLRSGLAGAVVELPAAPLIWVAWLCLTPFVVGWLAVQARGWWARAAAVALVFALPLPALMFYGLGAWDSAPWWEAISGIFIGLAGLLLVLAALRRAPAPVAVESGAEVAAGATT